MLLRHSLCAFSLVQLIVLGGCGSTPPKTTSVNKPVVAEKIKTEVSAKQWIERAKASYAATGDLQQRNQLLLNAVHTFYEKQQCEQASKIGHLLLPELQTAQQQHIQLTLIDCALQQMESSPSLQANNAGALLDWLNTLQINREQQPRAFNLYARIYQQQQNWLPASQNLLASEATPGEHSEKIWQWLNRVDNDALAQASRQPSTLTPWLELVQIRRQNALSVNQLQQAVAGWQQRYPNHPLAQVLPSELQAALAVSPIQSSHIGVLLPLSGRLTKQGETVKQGILAAYFANPYQRPRLSFIDSNLEFDLQNEQYDMVVGPLLKDNIPLVQQGLPEGVPLLALNQASSDITHPDHYFFGLSPEEEAEQLAYMLHKKGYQNPIIIAANQGSSKRMAHAFSQFWQELQGVLPTLSLYQNSKQMRKQITQMLDIRQSQSRIKRIENLASQEVFGVPRNRQDIDSAVLFADPNETKLLNPIIEASVSPFSRNKIAVFASSRSHKHILDPVSLRDLRGLTFTDMPWLLSQARQQTLSDQLETLWPNKTEAEKRLFALGFDAYQLIPFLRQLRANRGSAYSGLTGQISISEDGNIHRHLGSAQITQQGITPLD